MQETPVNPITIYGTQRCPFCKAAEDHLKRLGVTEITKIPVDTQMVEREEMIRRTGRRTVPQIFVGETHVGGYDDLVRLDRAGELIPLFGR
jgi:glutaredoxin 3